MHSVCHILHVLVLVQQGLGVLGGGSCWPLGLVIVEDGRVLALGLRAVRPELLAPAAAAWIGYRINLTFSPKMFLHDTAQFWYKVRFVAELGMESSWQSSEFGLPSFAMHISSL